MLADLSEEERHELAARLRARSLATGDTLFEEGQEADALVLLESGCLRVSSARGGESAAFPPGSALGGLALFRIGTREASACAVEDCRVWLLSRGDYRRLADDSPRAALRLAEAVLADVAEHARAALPAHHGTNGGGARKGDG